MTDVETLFNVGMRELRLHGEVLADRPLSRGLIAELIQLAISHGAEIYNLGGHRFCYLLYAEVAAIVQASTSPAEGSLAARDHRDLIQAAARAGDTDDESQSAWIMRHAFDKVLAGFELGGQEIRLMVELGQRAFARADYGGAIDAFEHALDMFEELAGIDPSEVSPTWRIAWFLMGHARIAEGNYDMASRSLRRGLKLMPEWGDMNIDLQDQYLYKEELDVHETALEEHVASHTGDFDARFVQAYMRFFTGQKLSASQLLCQLVQLNPEDEDAAYLLALLAEPA